MACASALRAACRVRLACGWHAVSGMLLNRKLDHLNHAAISLICITNRLARFCVLGLPDLRIENPFNLN
jgi:hypothetical protein